MIFIDKNGVCYKGILRYILGICSPSLSLVYGSVRDIIKQGIIIKVGGKE